MAGQLTRGMRARDELAVQNTRREQRRGACDTKRGRAPQADLAPGVDEDLALVEHLGAISPSGLVRNLRSSRRAHVDSI